MSTPILEAKDYHAYFYTRRGIVKAVNGINFKLNAGETLGIVGESGSGKSVTQLSYLGLLPSPPLKIAGGEVLYKGRNLLSMPPKELRQVRGNKISMIFQEPMTSLNPYMKVGKQLIEPLRLHRDVSKPDAIKESVAALKKVGLADADAIMGRYPHELSGGMRQRVMIAMALTTKPDVLIADEPTTALDVTVQAQILELLHKIQADTGMAIILITHDLGIIAGLANRVLVMYAGQVMEEGLIDQLFHKSAHPYTKALLQSTPRMDLAQEKLPAIAGQPPDLTRLTSGCPFYPRCTVRMDVCKDTFPVPKSVGDQHQSFCHLEGDIK